MALECEEGNFVEIRDLTRMTKIENSRTGLSGWEIWKFSGLSRVSPRTVTFDFVSRCCRGSFEGVA